MNKIGIIGFGNVGLAIVHEFCTLNMNYEIIIIDDNRKKALSNIDDFNHMLSQTRLKYGAYKDLINCDIVILCAGIKNCSIRNVFLEKSCLMISKIMDNLNKIGFVGNIIVVSNPNDVLTTYVSQNYYCFHKVIGTGCILDINRLNFFLKRKDTRGIIIGEHGKCQKVIWDTFKNVSVNQKKMYEEKVINIAEKIVDGKGFTNYAIASCVVSLTIKILSDYKFNLVASFYDEKEKVAYSYPLICERKQFKHDENFNYSGHKDLFVSKIKNEYQVFEKGINIGIDLDDTITNIQSEMKKYAKIFDKENNGQGIINKDKYLVGEMYGWNDEIRDKFFNTYRKKVICNAKIRNDVIRIFSKWHQLGYKIIIITARNSKYYLNPYMETYNWLKENNIPFDQLVVESSDKKSICSRLNINFYIDDMPINCNRVNEITDTMVFIMDNGNNYGENKGIIRVKSFKEMDKVIENV